MASFYAWTWVNSESVSDDEKIKNFFFRKIEGQIVSGEFSHYGNKQINDKSTVNQPEFNMQSNSVTRDQENQTEKGIKTKIK